MERIRSEVEAQESFGKVVAQITITGGIAAYPIDGSSESEILRKADQALYRAKKTGRNSIRLAYEEKMAPKTSHFTLTQLERLSNLSKEEGVGEAVLLREALDDLLIKYGTNDIES
jgi:predicted signal transduction protein with EAL and GGDEF domain